VFGWNGKKQKYDLKIKKIQTASQIGQCRAEIKLEIYQISHLIMLKHGFVIQCPQRADECL
jgi:hypothetical protein